MSGDVHVRICEHVGVRFPRVTRPVVHCRSQRQAEYVMRAIASRLTDCELTMHPEKSTIVYCKDSNRRETHPHVSFTFLGFTFRPRRAKSHQGCHFTSFLPAASEAAMRRMRQAVRGWRLTRQTHVTLAEVAKLYNPVIQGWWNYYGAFYQTAMQELFQHIDRALGRWVRRKFKTLSGRSRRSAAWLGKMRDAYPRLFCHWYVAGLRVG
jgi:RNA-directed DNA polymerase